MKNLCVIAILALILASCQESLEDRQAMSYQNRQDHPHGQSDF